MQGVHRILVCRPNHRLGNILLLTPLLAELEQRYPAAEVDVVVGSGVGAELFSQFPRVRNVFNLTPRIVRHPFLLASVLRKIRAAHYDVAIDPTQHSMSGRIIMLVAQASYSIGVSPLRRSRGDTVPAAQHLARRPVDALRRALPGESGIEEAECPPLSLRLTPAEHAAGRKVLIAIAQTSETQRIVGVFTNATGRKLHGEAWWVAMIEQMRCLRPDVLILEFIAAHGKSQLSCRYRTFYSSHPRQLAAVISQLNCFISADCGVMHLAASSGVTTIGLFSVTNPLEYQPYSGMSRSIVTVDRSPESVAEACIEAIDCGRLAKPAHNGSDSAIAIAAVADACFEVDSNPIPG